MEMSLQERVKVNDYKAHLNALQVELSVVSGQLEIALSDRSFSEEELKKTNERLALARTALSKAEEDAARAINESHISYEQCQREEERIKEERRALSFHIETETDALATRKRAVEGSVKLLCDEMSVIAGEKTVLESEVRTLRDKILPLEEKIAELERKHRALENSIESETSAHEGKLASLKRGIASSQKIFSEVNRAVEEEKRKIDFPKQALADREMVVKRREYNFEIMKARMKKHFEQMYPGQTLNI